MDLPRLLAFASENPLLVTLFALLTVALIYTEIARLFRGFKGVSPAELTDLINREDALVLDLRGPTDFDKGHIAGSKNLLGSQVDPGHKLLAAAKERPVALVCQSGMSAGDVAAKLRKAGFSKLFVLDGGVAAWQSAGLPLAKGRG